MKRRPNYLNYNFIVCRFYDDGDEVYFETIELEKTIKPPMRNKKNKKSKRKWK